MENRTLVALLTTRGIVQQEQFGFRSMVGDLPNDARIVCAELQKPDGFHGISFWLYGHEDAWFLGLWSGAFFKVANPEQLPDIAAELLSGQTVPQNVPPGDLPESFLAKYQLTRIT